MVCWAADFGCAGHAYAQAPAQFGDAYAGGAPQLLFLAWPISDRQIANTPARGWQ